MLLRKDIRLIVMVNGIGLCIYIYMNVPEKESFGKLQYRIWQFLTGMLAYLLGSWVFSNDETIFQNVNKANLENGSIKPVDNEHEGLINGKVKTKANSVFYKKQDTFLGVITLGLFIFMSLLVIDKIGFFDHFNVVALRAIVTITAGIVLLIGFVAQSFIMTNKILLYIGDISYILYLVHWPILTFVRYYSTQVTFDVKDGLFIIISSVFVAAFIHEYIEKSIIQSKIKLGLIFSLTLIFEILVFSLIYIDPLLPGMVQTTKLDPSKYFFEAAGYPDGYVQYLFPEFVGNDTYKRLIEKYPVLPSINKKRICLNASIKYPNGGDYDNFACEDRKNGTLNVLIIGNSFAEAHYDAIQQALGDRYSVIRMYCHNRCVPFGCESEEHCAREISPSMLDFVKAIKPDILFIIVKYDDGFDKPLNDIKNDSCVKSASNVLSEISNYTKVILFPDEEVTFKFQISYEMSKRLSKNMPIEDMKILETVILVHLNLL
uniref:SGNH domain-containing protein n=1 Tax=Acrobeloides nanus TaxID=290746 RepID=A0A914E2P9_9BILA